MLLTNGRGALTAHSQEVDHARDFLHLLRDGLFPCRVGHLAPR
jgi:hypothetical protein